MEIKTKYDLTDIPQYKSYLNDKIDNRTSELIALGFTYSTKQFSLSASAQSNLLGLDLSKDDPALTYPIKYNTIDDLDSYSVPDSTDMHSMFLTALATKKGHLDSGTVLKQQVRDATTISELDLVIDNR